MEILVRGRPPFKAAETSARNDCPAKAATETPVVPACGTWPQAWPGEGVGVGELPALSLQRRSRGGQRLRVEWTGGTACGSWAGRRRAPARLGRPAGSA